MQIKVIYSLVEIKQLYIYFFQAPQGNFILISLEKEMKILTENCITFMGNMSPDTVPTIIYQLHA